MSTSTTVSYTITAPSVAPVSFMLGATGPETHALPGFSADPDLLVANSCSSPVYLAFGPNVPLSNDCIGAMKVPPGVTLITGNTAILAAGIPSVVPVAGVHDTSAAYVQALLTAGNTTAGLANPATQFTALSHTGGRISITRVTATLTPVFA